MNRRLLDNALTRLTALRLGLPHGRLLGTLAVVLALVWLWPIPRAHGIAHYAPLHTILEMAAIVIAFLIFAVVWHVERGEVDGRLLVLGILFAGVGLFDTLHTLSYNGMPDFITPASANKAISFWLLARFLAALAFLVVALPARVVPSGRAFARGLLGGRCGGCRAGQSGGAVRAG